MYREKAKQGYNRAITVEELKVYAQKNSSVPVDKNTAYVIFSNIEGPQKFCIVWTTLKLAEEQQKWKIIHVDATYKILSYGFPMMVYFYYLNCLYISIISWQDTVTLTGNSFPHSSQLHQTRTHGLISNFLKLLVMNQQFSRRMQQYKLQMVFFVYILFILFNI